MLTALWTASTGMEAQMTNLDVVSNNLANANTTAFKKSRAEFQDLLYQSLASAGETTGPDNMDPVGQQVGVGVKLAAITKHIRASTTKAMVRTCSFLLENSTRRLPWQYKNLHAWQHSSRPTRQQHPPGGLPKHCHL